MYTKFVSTNAEAEIDNRMIGAAFFTTLAVTIWTTVLIAYRIYSTSDLDPIHKKNRFYNILEIIIQSSFVYSLALIPTALTVVIPPQNAAANTASNFLGATLSGITVCGTVL